jgi:hypothetical protein
VLPEQNLRSSASKPLPDLPSLPPIVNSRADILRVSSSSLASTFQASDYVADPPFLAKVRINDLNEAILRVKKLVQNDLSLAKHLSILTPFRSSTREKVLTAIPPVERRIRQTRME